MFFDNNHTYELDGQKLTSVSEIIRFISREVYGEINQYALDNAAERGTRVHRTTQTLDTAKEVECDDDIVGYIRAYIRFCKEHTVQWDCIEKSLASTDLGIAGTIDRRGAVDGQYCTVDIKTNSVVKKTLVKAQLNGYEILCKENKLRQSEKLYCLQLMQDGKYRLYECTIDDTEFKSCLAIHNALNKTHKRGVIE